MPEIASTMMTKEVLASKLPLHLSEYLINKFEGCEQLYKCTINKYEIKEEGNNLQVKGYDNKGRCYTVSEPIVKIPRSELDEK